MVNGELLEKWEIPTRKDDNFAYVLPDVAEQVEKKLSEKGITKEEVLGIGFGTHGPVSEDGTVIISANLHWRNKPVAKELSCMTGLPCMEGNDVNTAGLGEMWQGGARGYKNAVVIPIGTGVGAAIIVNGKIIAGTSGAAGEVGHIHIDDEIDMDCGCGARGCVEQFSSATGLVRMAKKISAETDRPTVLREIALASMSFCSYCADKSFIAGYNLNLRIRSSGLGVVSYTCDLYNYLGRGCRFND